MADEDPDTELYRVRRGRADIPRRRMPAYVEHKNRVISELGAMLATLEGSGRARPSPTVPKSRAHSHVFIEQPLDEAMFIYGGFVCDPTE